MEWPLWALTLLRIIHIGSAALLIGGLFFNYVLLRPTLTLIPPPQHVVVNTRIGTLFVYLAWITLGLLVASGLLRLEAMGLLDNLASADFWLGRYGRWLGVMLAGWLIATIDAAILTFVTKPILRRRLPLNPRPTATTMHRRRDTQILVSEWVERLLLVNLIALLMALIAGASLMFGGLI